MWDYRKAKADWARRAAGPEDHARMEREAREAERSLARLEARRRRIWRMAADAALAAAGAALTLLLQGLWRGEALWTLVMGAAAASCWVAAGVIREARL